MELAFKMVFFSILLPVFVFAQDSVKVNPKHKYSQISNVGEISSAVMIIKKKNGLYEAYRIITPNQGKNINCKEDQDFIVGNKLTAEEFKVLTDKLYVINGNFEAVDKKTGEHKSLIFRGGRLIEVNPSGK